MIGQFRTLIDRFTYCHEFSKKLFLFFHICDWFIFVHFLNQFNFLKIQNFKCLAYCQRTLFVNISFTMSSNRVSLKSRSCLSQPLFNSFKLFSTIFYNREDGLFRSTKVFIYFKGKEHAAEIDHRSESFSSASSDFSSTSVAAVSLDSFSSSFLEKLLICLFEYFLPVFFLPV